MLRILFLEPFDGGSHRAFLAGLVRASRHEIVPLTLPAGEWRARTRRGVQELAELSGAIPGSFDAVVATDMVDLPVFLALTRPRFAGTPILFYMHENQFTYPRIRGTKLNSWFGAMNYLSALAADRVAFNSAYHRDDFLAALRTLATQPNNWLRAPAIGTIAARSSVLPIGVDLPRPAAPRTPSNDGPLILWNHRWEFDKAPDVFARAVLALAAEGRPFRLAIAGEPGPNPHPALFELRDRLAERVVQFGPAATRAAYEALLCESDVVVSTTRHEFFGIGMVEALAAGCFPVAPRRFTYPELVPPELHSRCLYDDEAGLVALLRAAIAGPPAPPGLLRESAERFAWERVGPQWDAFLEALAGLRPHSADADVR